MKILAIETSCDDTALSIMEAGGNLKQPEFKLLAHIVSSQIDTHRAWGGVVPNLAKREHEKNIIPLLRQTITEASLFVNSIELTNRLAEGNILNTKYSILNTILAREPELLGQFKKFIPKIKKPDIDLIAVTHGPGLEPA